MEQPLPSTPMPAPLVDSNDLRRVLDAALHGGGAGRTIRVVDLRRRPSAYYSSFLMEDLDVTLEDGTTHAMVFKDLSPRARLAASRRVKPSFLHQPLREIQVYAHVLEHNGLGAPRFYGASVDPQAGRYLLFLERVASRPLWQVGEFEAWRQAARRAAATHAAMADRIESSAAAPWLLRYDAAFYRMWLDRARAALDARSAGGPRAAFDRLAERYDRVVERLVALPRTFIHGEFYPSNVLIEGGGAGADALRVRPVDWEMAAVGPGLMDLADLSSGKWTAYQKDDLARAYREALPPHAWPGGAADFDEALACCRLHRAVQWLGWAADGSDWSPPPEHANDWLAEAVRLGDALT